MLVHEGATTLTNRLNSRPYYFLMIDRELTSTSPDETFALGKNVGRQLKGGEVILLTGGLGAGKTLLAKGILYALDYDTDEVTSPSFTLVNLYKTKKFDVYHIDLWRLDSLADPARGVGLYEILEEENAVVIIEWADRLGNYAFYSDVIIVTIEGDGDADRRISLHASEANILST